MKYKYAVTFEFDTQKPITDRGEIYASSLRTASARAIDNSISNHPNMQWASVCILIERI